MKTNFMKVDGRYVVKTGKVVAVDFINLGDDYDVILGDQVMDVCTGETFALELDYNVLHFTDEKLYHLVKHFDEMPEYNIVRHGNPKKIRRQTRIESMVGAHWTKQGNKRMGKTRFLSRRLYPNAQQLADYEGYLPF